MEVGRLLPHQREGVKWLVARESDPDIPGGFLCDEMGLGKTVQLIATMHRNPVPRTLIIVPKSLVTQWETELARFAPNMDVHLFDGPKRFIKGDAHVTVAPYSVLPQRKGAPPCPLLGLFWDRIILDEGHEIRNQRSKSHVVAKALAGRIRWIVSGTPIFNSVKDFVALGSFLGIPRWRIQGELSLVRARYLLRRTKEDCTRFTLPPCAIDTLELDMGPAESAMYQRVYHQSQQTVSDIVRQGVENTHQMEMIECLLRVRQVMAWPQLYLDGMATKEGTEPVRWEGGSAKMDALVSAIESHPTEKALVFGQFMGEMDEIQNRLVALGVPVFRIDGSIDTERRSQRLEAFRTGPANSVFLIQIKAGGVGLNLQEATRVYITTPAWNPATELQAIARAHRNGQTQKVHVTKLIYKGTDDLPSIEESIMTLQGHKQAVCADVLQDERLRSQLPCVPKSGINARAVRKIFAV